MRQQEGRNDTPSLLILDSQSVKNTCLAQKKGYDAGKKISGIKRHIAVDILGLPIAIATTTADVTDRDGGFLALVKGCSACKEAQTVMVDGAYTLIQEKSFKKRFRV